MPALRPFVFQRVDLTMGLGDKVAGFFITGTDTGVGKTWATVALMRFLRAEGLSVLGMKPVASGCFWRNGELRNEDALSLRENASFPVEYAKLNIYAFEQAISPHLAARMAGRVIDLGEIVRQCRDMEWRADCLLVEGVGGWEVPLNASERVSHLAVALEMPVILVVGMRLGCLSHAVLTHDAILRSGVDCAGWIANCLEADFACQQENIETLFSALTFPCLGVISRGEQWREKFPNSHSDATFFSLGREEILRRLAV